MPSVVMPATGVEGDGQVGVGDAGAQEVGGDDAAGGSVAQDVAGDGGAGVAAAQQDGGAVGPQRDVADDAGVGGVEEGDRAVIDEAVELDRDVLLGAGTAAKKIAAIVWPVKSLEVIRTFWVPWSA